MLAATLKQKACCALDGIADQTWKQVVDVCTAAAEKGDMECDAVLRVSRADKAFDHMLTRVTARAEAAGLVVKASRRDRREITISWEGAEAAVTPAQAPRGNLRSDCPICTERCVVQVLTPCGHSVCLACLGDAGIKRCPLCRGHVAGVVPVFLSGNDDGAAASGPADLAVVSGVPVNPFLDGGNHWGDDDPFDGPLSPLDW
mmetsp:Transcript_19675/g.42365  ORF Transcript_19675/g.42365 Transcript_19675/m.42365 type:complete len:202 (-) Transcript_19675:230-835(-)